MAHYTLIARINAGNGKFPFVNVQFSRNHRPIPIDGATYYLRPSNSGKRTPIRIGKDLALAQTALVRLEGGQSFELPATVEAKPRATVQAIFPERRFWMRLTNISNVAGRNRVGLTLAIARPSTYSSRAAKKPISTRFAVTTCSTFCTSCGYARP